MKEYIPKRIQALQEILRQKELDAAMIYDRENLIYFAGVDDLEGGALAVPAQGEPELFCLWLDGEHMKKTSGIEKVTPYYFPTDNQSTMMGKWLQKRQYKKPRLGFTRYFISLKDFQCLREAAPDFYVGDIAQECYKIRAVKCAGEIARMEMAAKALTAGMQAAIDCIRPGILETDVLAEADYAMAKAGSQGASFRMQVLTFSRQMLMHPYAGPYSLENNGPVLVHLGASFKGYVAKMCRTVFLGTPPEETVRIYDTLKEVQQNLIAALKPGVSCGNLVAEAERTMAEKGYGKYWMVEHIGYGVGIRQSEFYPVIAKDSPVLLEENMVVDLLLPSIYMPKIGGPRITDTILVQKDGARLLTEFSNENIFK